MNFKINDNKTWVLGGALASLGIVDSLPDAWVDLPIDTTSLCWVLVAGLFLTMRDKLKRMQNSIDALDIPRKPPTP